MRGLIVPADVQGDAVVSEDQCRALGIGQARDPDAGDLVHPEAHGCGEAPVPGDDDVMLVDEEGGREPEPLDGGRDLTDLRIGVRTRVAVIPDKGTHRREMDLCVPQARVGAHL